VSYGDTVLPLTCEFQQVNDPKRTSKAVKDWFGEEEIKVTT
jgi:hypothetical protein